MKINHEGKAFYADSAADFLEMGLPEAAILDAEKSAAVSRIKQQHAAALKLLSGAASTEERDTWPVQLQAAQAFISGTKTPEQTAMLTALLVPGETKTALAKNIVAKNMALQDLIGMAGGLKRQTERAVKEATTIEAIEAAMDEAAQKMDAAIAVFKKKMAEAAGGAETETTETGGA